jgi:hypothetical protein
LEDESGGTLGVGQKEVRGIDGIRRKEQPTGSDAQKALGAFQDGGAGVATFSRTVANKQASHVAFDQMLIEVSKEMTQALVGPAAGVGEQIDERVENDETGVHAFNSFKETGQILGEGEGTIARWMRGFFGVLDVREDFDT